MAPTISLGDLGIFGLLYDSAAGVRLQLDLPESGFVLRDVLLQIVEQRFGLLVTDVDALKIMNRHVVRRRLANTAEHQEEIPKIHANLYAVRIIFAIFRGIDELNLRCGLLRHN